MKEDFKFIGQRRQLVEQLRQKGIRNQAVLDAIGKVPRQYFMNETFVNDAYKDDAFPIDSGQTISQPSTVAMQTELLNVRPGEKVLEIGTGSGYQAAVLATLGVELFSIERHKKLFESTHKKFRLLGYNVNCSLGDGFEGLPEKAPFDKIIVTAGAPEIPQNLLKQLKVGGIMVIPCGVGKNQQMYLIRRISEYDFESKKIGNCAFVPMLKGVVN
jgi:protein-L-isoaspartate(D-aspartate) O-methyltransferase